MCTGSLNNRFIEQNNSWHVRYKMFLVRFFAVFYKTTNSVLSGNVNHDGNFLFFIFSNLSLCSGFSSAIILTVINRF